MRILGIDPGLRLTGYGCLDPAPPPDLRARTRSPAPAASVVEAGVLRLNVRASVADRLVELDSDFSELLVRLRPDLVAVETLFVHPVHPQTAILMAHARGVLLLGARRAGLALVELRATEVKKAIATFGHARKSQMQLAVREALALSETPKPPDVADALAIALCALRRSTSR